MLIGLGLAGALLGVLAGVTQGDPKTILAYSSISQMGWMAAIVGVGLRVPEACPQLHLVALAYVPHQGLIKGALLLGTGVVAGGYQGDLLGFWPGSASLYRSSPWPEPLAPRARQSSGGSRR